MAVKNLQSPVALFASFTGVAATGMECEGRYLDTHSVPATSPAPTPRTAIPTEPEGRDSFAFQRAGRLVGRGESVRRTLAGRPNQRFDRMLCTWTRAGYRPRHARHAGKNLQAA